MVKKTISRPEEQFLFNSLGKLLSKLLRKINRMQEDKYI